MNKTIKRLTVATLACVALCGTAMAAPHHGRAPRPAPIHHRAPVHHHPGHRPPPPPPPARTVIIEEHHDANPLAVLGGAIIGGIIGAIAG